MKTRDRLRYQSEYKKQFDWKKPLEQEAPILSAEKMIYGVQGDEHPVIASKVKMPKKTEYQLNFVKHPIISSPEIRKDLLDKHLIGNYGDMHVNYTVTLIDSFRALNIVGPEAEVMMIDQITVVLAQAPHMCYFWFNITSK